MEVNSVHIRHCFLYELHENFERRNAERPIFRNFKIRNIKTKKDELFPSLIFEFIFSLFINYLHNLIIYQIVK